MVCGRHALTPMPMPIAIPKSLSLPTSILTPMRRPPPKCFCDRNLNHRLVFGRQLRKSISPLLFSLSMSDFIPSTAYSSPELVDPGLFPLPFVLTYSPNELPNLVISPHSPPRRIMMLPKMSGSDVAVCGQVKDSAFWPSSLRLASFSGGWLG